MSAIAGPYIPGTFEPALHRLLAAILCSDLEESERAARIVHAISGPINFTSKKRVWWRIPPSPGSDDPQQPSYISLRPGEFTTSEPRGADIVIMDCPPLDNSPSLLRDLRDFLASKHLPKPLPGTEPEVWLAAANRILAGKQPQATRQAADKFQQASLAARSPGSTPASRSALIQTLFDECLFGFETSNFTFSLALMLLQFQIMTGQWIQENAFHDPLAFLNSLTEYLSRTMPERAKVALQEIGNATNDLARAAHKASLTANTLVTQQRQLMEAAHHYLIATKAAHLNERFNLGATLKYPLITAEEGFACTRTGILGGLHCLLRDVDQYVREISVRSAEPGWNATSSRLEISSPVMPIFPKRLADAMIARAQTFTASHPHFAGGLAALEKLQQGDSSGAAMEDVFGISYLDYCLLQAYRLSGNQAKAESCAMRFAARVVMERAFSSH